MNAYDVINLCTVNDVDRNKVDSLKKSIRELGWEGAPILVSDAHGMLITGSHRRQALIELDNEGFNIGSLGDIAESVDDLIDAWCTENECTFDNIRFDCLSDLFGGTWVEKYKDDIVEW